MKLHQKLVLVLLLISQFGISQDSTIVKEDPRPEKPHELGVSILSPLLMLADASDNSDRFTNLVYRYRLTEHHAIKFFAGQGARNVYTADPFLTGTVRPTTFPSVYQTSTKTRPSNFQVGTGYEYIGGGGRLKHVPGAEIVYSNVFEKQEFYFVEATQKFNPIGQTVNEFQRLDTGSFIVATNFHKIGFNLCYSLRYEFMRRFILTGTLITSTRFVTFRRENQTISNLDFNLLPIGDVSLYYRF